VRALDSIQILGELPDLLLKTVCNARKLSLRYYALALLYIFQVLVSAMHQNLLTLFGKKGKR
jgi:hypothetical protein